MRSAKSGWSRTFVVVGVLGCGAWLLGRDAGRAEAGQALSAPTMQAVMLQEAFNEAAGKVLPAVVLIRTDRGLGSGILYDASGLILTNNHVIDGAAAIQVRLADHRELTGQLLGTDPLSDVAVVKVEAGEPLP